MNPDKEFWRGRNVLITGHTGFKGGWLAHWLQLMGARVTGYSIEPPTVPNLFEESKLYQIVNSVHGDVRDLFNLKKVISNTHPEVIFHLAAQPLVRYSYDHPIETYETNVMGTVNLLEAARGVSSVRAVVCITTDKCYENKEWVWGYRENDPMGGHDPYSSSKGCSELAISAYRRSFFSSDNRAGIASVRAGNVIGGGDWGQDRLIPDIIKAFGEKKEVVIRNPKAIRPWQHVLEPLCGYLLLAERICSSGASYTDAWNFGPNDSDAQTVEWIVNKMVRLWGEEAKWTNDKAAHPHEARYLKLDISKAKTVLGYSPRLEIETTLEWVVNWYKKRKQGADVALLTQRQIEEFEKIIT